ncbi:MAG: PIN domain-containing protein [Luteimonas sp.]|nr:PIN domain-containing protein [Luteimonas sp.]
MHYVLIDYENVQPADLAGLDAEQAFVLVFTGAEQKVGIGLIEAVQALGEHGRFIRITGNGRNALDFHIAYYLGQWVMRDPQATFLIVSKDTGYDPLVAHLNANGTRIKRISVDSPSKKEPVRTAKAAIKKVTKKVATPAPKKATPAKKTTKKVTKAEKTASGGAQSDADKIIKGLKGMPKNLPGSDASLRRMAATWLASKDAARMDKAIAELSRRQVIALSGSKVQYSLPK